MVWLFILVVYNPNIVNITRVSIFQKLGFVYFKTSCCEHI